MFNVEGEKPNPKKMRVVLAVVAVGCLIILIAAIRSMG